MLNELVMAYLLGAATPIGALVGWAIFDSIREDRQNERLKKSTSTSIEKAPIDWKDRPGGFAGIDVRLQKLMEVKNAVDMKAEYESAAELYRKLSSYRLASSGTRAHAHVEEKPTINDEDYFKILKKD